MPNALAFLPSAADAGGFALSAARVLSVQDGQWLVQAADGPVFAAIRAAGCLLDPAEGDLVLVAKGRPSWILQILARTEAPATLSLPADTILAGCGKLSLAADEIHLEAREAMRAEAPELALAGLKGQADFAGLALSAGRCDARVGHLSLAARVVETAAERLVQKLGDCFRRIRRLDDTEAGQSRIRIDGRLDTEAADVSLAAREDMKIDGKQVRLG